MNDVSPWLEQYIIAIDRMRPDHAVNRPITAATSNPCWPWSWQTTVAVLSDWPCPGTYACHRPGQVLTLFVLWHHKGAVLALAQQDRDAVPLSDPVFADCLWCGPLCGIHLNREELPPIPATEPTP